MASEKHTILIYCPCCKQEKEASAFHKDRRSATGYQCYCITCHKVMRDIYRNTHRIEIRDQSKTYYVMHREERHIYYEEHRDQKKAYDKEYSLREHEKVKAKDKAKRARKYTATVERFNDIEIFTRDKWICQLCHRKVNRRLKYPHPLSPSLDHIIPLSKGGVHSRQNCCLVHLQCNNRKQNRSVSQQTRLF